MSTLPPPRLSTENKVLAAFHRPENHHFFSQLEHVTLSLGEVIYEPDSKVEYVYFPVTAVFSMLTLMENGDMVEVGPVGNEGLVGLNVFFGATSTSPTLVLVHVAGTAMRIKAHLLRDELRTGQGQLPRLLLRYTQMLLAMTGQSSACNQLHTLDKQLARWLLMMHDYVGDELLLTHELISQTLGARRAGITGMAIDFKDEGLIEYTRGHIQLVDRHGLEARACECYRVIKEEYDRLSADLPLLAR
ncbi:MAG: Crp/Fnr family transcriptional regulator [Acidobacteriota bacterium]|nr:Crp/Fnr family transcriptional regulator [Acidobacteriota bacterium]